MRIDSIIVADYSLAIERKLAGLRVEAENDRLSGELSESLLPGRCSEKELLNIIIKQQSVGYHDFDS